MWKFLSMIFVVFCCRYILTYFTHILHGCITATVVIIWSDRTKEATWNEINATNKPHGTDATVRRKQCTTKPCAYLIGWTIMTMTSSNGNIFCVTGHLCREFTGHRWIPSQRPLTRSFDVSLIYSWISHWVNNSEAGDLRCPLWHHRNDDLFEAVRYFSS